MYWILIGQFEWFWCPQMNWVRKRRSPSWPCGRDYWDLTRTLWYVYIFSSLNLGYFELLLFYLFCFLLCFVLFVSVVVFVYIKHVHAFPSTMWLKEIWSIMDQTLNISLWMHNSDQMKSWVVDLYYLHIVSGVIKGKFSSGTEGALASKFNYDFE